MGNQSRTVFACPACEEETVRGTEYFNNVSCENNSCRVNSFETKP